MLGCCCNDVVVLDGRLSENVAVPLGRERDLKPVHIQLISDAQESITAVKHLGRAGQARKAPKTITTENLLSSQNKSMS